MTLLLFSESDLDDCRFPCQGNSPRESLSSQYVSFPLFSLVVFDDWRTKPPSHPTLTPNPRLELSANASTTRSSLFSYHSSLFPGGGRGVTLLRLPSAVTSLSAPPPPRAGLP